MVGLSNKNWKNFGRLNNLFVNSIFSSVDIDAVILPNSWIFDAISQGNTRWESLYDLCSQPYHDDTILLINYSEFIFYKPSQNSSSWNSEWYFKFSRIQLLSNQKQKGYSFHFFHKTWNTSTFINWTILFQRCRQFEKVRISSIRQI